MTAPRAIKSGVNGAKAIDLFERELASTYRSEPNAPRHAVLNEPFECAQITKFEKRRANIYHREHEAVRSKG